MFITTLSVKHFGSYGYFIVVEAEGLAEFGGYGLCVAPPLMHGAVLVEVPLAHAPEGAQQVPQAGPQPLDGVGVDLARARPRPGPWPTASGRG